MATRHSAFPSRLIKVSGLSVIFACVIVAAPAFAFASRSTHGIWVPKERKGAVSTTCPAGEKVAFGGLVAQFDPVHDAWVLPTGMRRTASGQWSVYGQSLSTSHGSRLTAVGYCDSAGPPITVEHTVSVPGNTVGGSVAKCPAGTVVVAGGFNTRAAPHFEIVKGLERIADDSWRATILNIDSAPTTITAIAYCGSGPAPTLVSSQVNVASNHGTTARATCPMGMELVFGGGVVTTGWANSLPHVVPFSFTAETTTRWSLAAENVGSAAGKVTALAYCR